MAVQFEWFWAVLLLPLPLLIRWLLPVSKQIRQSALRTPFLSDFQQWQGTASGRLRNIPWIFYCALLAWVLFVLALMRPQLLGEPQNIPASGRDLMLAVDLSGSMEQQDFLLSGRVVNRLTASKQVATEFIARRSGDRIGLILFGEQAYLQVPLTFDHDTVQTLLEETVIGLAGKKTAIGDAIGLAVKRLRERSEKNRILIIMTDGANTAGEVDPLVAADFARQQGLKIYTIGIGSDEQIRRTWFGSQRINPSQDLDEETLQAVSETTGGRYFRARDTEELQQIYRILDELEPIDDEVLQFRPQQAIFYWPLSLAGIIGMVLMMYLHKAVHFPIKLSNEVSN